jgi:hypothetical protein
MRSDEATVAFRDLPKAPNKNNSGYMQSEASTPTTNQTVVATVWKAKH